MNRASVIFIGTVEVTNHNPKIGLRQQTLVKFAVEEAFKGISPQVREVWVNPGSFTSCYASYPIGERFLVFAYGGFTMPPDTALMSTSPSVLNRELLPREFERDKKPTVYAAPECSGTRPITEKGTSKEEVEYLRAYKKGVSAPSVEGRVLEDMNFGIFDSDSLPGLSGVWVTITGNSAKRIIRTNSDGYYAFDHLQPGAYRVAPFLRPYKAIEAARQTVVPPDGCGVANFDMISPGVIQGRLVGNDSRPAVNVKVEVLRLTSAGKLIYYAEKEAQTNRHGQFRFDKLPSGNFEVGVNLSKAPDPEAPFVPTKWSANGTSLTHLMPGEHKQISPIQLPSKSAVRKLRAQVNWPDGRPAANVTVWAEVGDHAAAFGETDASGLARLEVLEGVPYTVEAKVWVHSGIQRKVARSGALLLTPGRERVELKLVLSKSTDDYR